MDFLPKELEDLVLSYKKELDNMDVKLLDTEDLKIEKKYIEEKMSGQDNPSIKMLLRHNYICVKLEQSVSKKDGEIKRIKLEYISYIYSRN